MPKTIRERDETGERSVSLSKMCCYTAHILHLIVISLNYLNYPFIYHIPFCLIELLSFVKTQ